MSFNSLLITQTSFGYFQWRIRLLRKSNKWAIIFWSLSSPTAKIPSKLILATADFDRMTQIHINRQWTRLWIILIESWWRSNIQYDTRSEKMRENSRFLLFYHHQYILECEKDRDADDNDSMMMESIFRVKRKRERKENHVENSWDFVSFILCLCGDRRVKRKLWL